MQRIHIGVVGDFAADRYVIGMTSRISREAPVLILKKQTDEVLAGQAGNSAANLAALGVRCTAFGVIGEDADGEKLAKALADRGVGVSGIVTARGARTIVKTRIFSGARHAALQQVIRIDDDEGLQIGPATRRELSRRLSAALGEFDAVLVSDYGYGTVNRGIWNLLGEARARARKGGRSRSLPRILDSRHGLGHFKDADVITPNENEAFAALGIGGVSAPEPAEVGRLLMKATRCRGLVLTQGNEGMMVFDGARRPVRIPIHGSDEVTDVTGAGDTVAAVVTAVVAAGGKLLEAAHLANVAAGLAVMKRGAATVSREELAEALAARR